MYAHPIAECTCHEQIKHRIIQKEVLLLQQYFHKIEIAIFFWLYEWYKLIIVKVQNNAEN